MVGVLRDSWEKMHMGITAENVAQRFGITRAQQDELAVLCQQREAAGIAAGRFKEQIVPVELKSRKGSPHKCVVRQKGVSWARLSGSNRHSNRDGSIGTPSLCTSTNTS